MRAVDMRQHSPTVVRRTDGSWGVICDACSHAAGDYMYPCQVRFVGDGWPPSVLHEHPVPAERDKK